MRAAARSLSTPFWAHTIGISCGACVVALHGEEHDIVRLEVELVRMRRNRDPPRLRAVGSVESQAVRLDGCLVRAPGYERHIVALLEQPSANDPADRAGAVHDESHERRALHVLP